MSEGCSFLLYHIIPPTCVITRFWYTIFFNTFFHTIPQTCYFLFYDVCVWVVPLIISLYSIQNAHTTIFVHRISINCSLTGSIFLKLTWYIQDVDQSKVLQNRLFRFLGATRYIPDAPPNKNRNSRFSGLCSDQQLSFFTLLDRASFPHYKNTKIIKFGWERFILWVISYGLSFSGFARFPEFRGTINDSFGRPLATKLSEYCVQWPVYCLTRIYNPGTWHGDLLVAGWMLVSLEE